MEKFVKTSYFYELSIDIFAKCITMLEQPVVSGWLRFDSAMRRSGLPDKHVDVVIDSTRDSGAVPLRSTLNQGP